MEITGSRIQRDGYDMPTPVTVMGEEDFQTDSPGSIAEFVNTMPSISGSTTASTNSGSLSAGGAGIAALNLRGLGTGRTLVLFDGQRSVVSATSGQVDTNTFPQPLVERVEIVTGGASSTYGSDAIAGVVNFILDRDFTGVKTEMQWGETTKHDDAREKITLTAGTPFADGRGHLLFSGEYYHKDGVHYTTRDWAEKGYFAMVNPDQSPGAPHFLVGEEHGIANYTPGGLIVSGPLEGTYFGEGGSVNQLEYGEVGGQWMIGGDWQYSTSGMLGTNSLAAEDNRDSAFGRASWALTDSTEVFVQGSWSEYEGYSHYINPTDRNITIHADNAFLPAEISDALAAADEDSFVMSTSNADMPASGSNNVRETMRWTVGIDGMFDAMGLGFNWNAYYQMGKTETDEHQLPTFNFARLAEATDAVINPATGEIVCRSTLSDPGNACVPLNRFGTGVANEDGLAYVLGRPRRQQEFEQDVFGLTFSTNDIEGWAGPIGLAFGGEYREESVDGYVEEQYISGWKYGNYTVTAGSYDVTEFFVELNVPLLDNLEMNTAARYTEYSTSGTVNTWKVGLTYQPIDSLTFRATQSRDIRAPNLGELYATGTARTNAISINGESVPFIQSLRGSTDVMPEEADAFGLGVVYQPGFLPGFSAAVDYYTIDVEGVIDSLSAEETANNCFEFGIQLYCERLNYDSNGVLQTIDLFYENMNSLEAEGLDVEASYTMALGPGELSIRALATHYMTYKLDDGVTAINQAGENTGSTPDWKYRISASYNVDSWTSSLTARGVSSGTVDNAYIECVADCPASVPPHYTINDNSVAGEIYFDLYVANSLTLASADTQLYLTVKNLFDTDPVLVSNPISQGSENMPGYPQTNRSLYDWMGRSFVLGMRMQF